MQILANTYTNIGNISDQTKNLTEEQKIIIQSSAKQMQTLQHQKQNLNLRHYDFTNMSRREYDEMWNNGELGVDQPPLLKNKKNAELNNELKAQMNSAYDTQMNYIEYYKSIVQYQKALPPSAANVSALEKTEQSLNKLVELQGKARHPRVNIQA